MNAVGNLKDEFPYLLNDGKLRVYSNGSYFAQNKALKPNNKSVINIYIVCTLNPIFSTRNTDYTIQNALLGAMRITKNIDYSKDTYTGYGICFDEGGDFSKGNINNGKNVIIFGVHESSLVHANSRAINNQR